MNMSKSTRQNLKRTRAEFRAARVSPNGRAGEWKVFDRTHENRFLGWVVEQRGRGAGYYWRSVGAQPNRKRYLTLSEAVIALGSRLGA